VRINFARLSLCTAKVKKQVKIVNAIKLLLFSSQHGLTFKRIKHSQCACLLEYSLVLRKVSNHGVNKKWLCQTTKMDNAVAKTTRFLPLAAFLFCIAFLFVPTHADARVKSHSHKHKTSHATPLIPAQSARYAMIIMDAQSGRILEEKDMHKVLPPASTTKIMTLFMTFEALQRGQLHMDDELKITQHAMSQAPSKIGLNPNNPITVREAIYVVVTRSANDVAMALAETIGGSEQRFCQMMTARAKSLGMHETNFANPSGLPNPAQKSSVYDMAVLGRATMQYFPQYYHIFNTIRYNYRGQTIETHNNLMRRFKGMDGLKTGYTVASGFNLVASSVRDNRRVIVVVFGGTSAVQRDNHVAALMTEGLDILTSGKQVAQVTNTDLPVSIATKTDTKTTKVVTTPSPQAANQNQTVATKTDSMTTTTVKTVDVKPIATTPATTATADRGAWQPDGGAVKPLGAVATSSTSNNITAPVSATSGNKNWGVQVGAYNSQSLGEQHAQAALTKLRSVLAGEGQTVVLPSTTKHGGTIYRARIIGLSAHNANKACHVLPQCMVFSSR
jgi:D-alanyl-D-alanine carboxypeptidase